MTNDIHQGPAWRFVCGQPWAITPDALQTVLAIAGRYNEDPEAVEARRGKPLDNTRKVTVREGIATIPIRGTITRYANLFSEISGATSVQALSTDIQTALEDPKVKGIVLEVDSPGGHVAGISELAGRIFAARGKKPIVSFVENLGASAAYYLAAAADKVVAAPMAMLGSIGVVLTVDTKERPNELTIVSSQSPNKRLDPKSGEGQTVLQDQVDKLAQVFINDVAKFRGSTPEDVAEKYGAGGLKVGEEAVHAGLADKVGDYESLLAEMISSEESKRKPAFLQALPKVSQAGTLTGAFQGTKTMNFAQKVKAWLSAGAPADMPEDQIDAAAVVAAAADAVSGVAVPAPVAEKPKTLTEADIEARVETLAKEKLEKTLRLNYAANADEFLSALVDADKLSPALKAGLSLLYVDAAMADSLSPLSVEGKSISRLEHFKGSLDAKAPRGKLVEAIPADASKAAEKIAQIGRILPNAHSEASDAADAQHNEGVRKLLEATPEGRALLAARAK